MNQRLDLADRIEFQKKEWRFQRVSWFVVSLALLAVALGAFGDRIQSILRALATYLFLLVMMRLTGKRTLAEMTTFDFVLLLIISEATQQAMIGEDVSLANGFIVITTLLALDVSMGFIKQRWPRMDLILDGASLILVKDGQPFKERLESSRIDMDDILSAARESHGIGNLDQIRHAILEKDGSISIIPERKKE